MFNSGVVQSAHMEDLYFALATTLRLQFENILLATSTKSQLQTVINNDWPFFINNIELVKTCLLESNCTGFRNLIQELGDIWPIIAKNNAFYHMYPSSSSFQKLEVYQRNSPYIRFTWLQMMMATFPHLHLSPSAPTRGDLLEKKDLNSGTLQCVTSLSQQYLRVSFVTHLTLQKWTRTKPEQEEQVGCFCL